MKETVNKNIWTIFFLITCLVAVVCLVLMLPRREYFLTAVTVGILAFFWDFIIECFGVSKSLWKYSKERFAIAGVPLEVPLIFSSCAIIVTFWFYAFETNPMANDFLDPVLGGLSLIQLGLIITGIFFMIQYFRKKIYTMVFWLLPFGIAFYLAYPEPWILVLALIPMYLDYFIERALVRRKKIEYEEYDSELAINVAISYFPVTVVLLGLIALIVHFFKG